MFAMWQTAYRLRWLHLPPTATSTAINLRDGATGAGTVIWTQAIGVFTTPGENAIFSVCGLNLIGSAATAMTLEFGTLVTGAVESVSLSGYDVE